MPVRLIATLVAILMAAVTLSADQDTDRGGRRPHVYVPGPPDNPLKGFLPFQGRYDRFPHSMEYANIPWRDIQKDYDEFSWETIEAILDGAASRGNQAVLRIYVDYPGQPYAMPEFLTDVPARAYDDHGNGSPARSFAPDYDDRRVVRAMTNTIKAFGRRYDGDPRVGFVMVGFIGFWGEWHTYRPSCGCDSWMPSLSTQRKVLDTFDDAFRRTRLVVRNPDVGWNGQRIGFHDDSFAAQTLDPPGWTFVGRMKRAGATGWWRHEPIGGEVRPELQPCLFGDPPCYDSQDFDASVDATHASWLINHHAFTRGYAWDDYERAHAGAQRLGYDLFVSSVETRFDRSGRRLSVAVTIENRGVAPFYYDWPVQLALADDSGEVVLVANTSWKLTRVVDRGVPVRFTYDLKQLSPGGYSLLMRAVNPLPNGKPLVFANELWEATTRGWLTLDTVDVADSRR